MTLINSAPSEKLKMSTVKESMLNEEARRKARGLIGSSSKSDELVTESRGRSQSRNFHRRDNSESCSKSRSKSRTRKEVICYHCGKAGHIKRNCRFLKRDQSRERDEDKEKKNDKDITTVASVNNVYIVCDANSINLACQDST